MGGWARQEHWPHALGGRSLALRGRPPQRRAKFWDALHDTLVGVVAKFPGAATFLLIDTNGRVGHAPPATGPCGTAPTNRNGASLLATLDRLGMQAANTFFDAGHT